MKRYLRFWLILTGLLLALTAGINLIVDPYGLFRLVDSAGFNQIKPTAGKHGRMVKAYQVLRIRPHGLILGNSRAEVGFDPAHPAWPPDARPVYDLALPGTDTYDSVMYLRHVLASQKANPPTLVVWGIDFMDFLVDAKASRSHRKASQQDSRLLANEDGTRNPGRAFQVVKDYAASTFTLRALSDSITMLVAQHQRYPEDLTSLGSNPMRDYIRITADEGAWAVFRQRDLANMQSFLRRPRDIFDENDASSPPLDDLRQVIRLCRDHGVRLHLVIYPYHAHLLEIFRVTGHWPAFEAWKQAVLHIAYEEPVASGFPPVPLWDFSQFDAYTEEAVPPKGDRKATMKWYWEAGHFKRELGDLVLDRVLSVPGAPEEFGVLLIPANIAIQLARVRKGEREYRSRHTAEINELEASAMRWRAQGEAVHSLAEPPPAERIE